jgi:hypothetical protein
VKIVLVYAETRTPALFLACAWLGVASCGGKSQQGASQVNTNVSSTAAEATGASSAGGTGGASAGSGAVAGMAMATPDECTLPADFVCTGTHTTPGCACNPALVTGEKDCESTAQLVCDCAMGDWHLECVPENLVWDFESVVCRCDTSAPLTPDDCPHRQQFFCSWPEPFLEGCHCWADAPLSAAECGVGQAYSCASYDPDTSCGCRSIMPKK